MCIRDSASAPAKPEVAPPGSPVASDGWLGWDQNKMGEMASASKQAAGAQEGRVAADAARGTC
eukprot:5662687-Alexandrium_andersonii.AAC.1